MKTSGFHGNYAPEIASLRSSSLFVHSLVAAPAAGLAAERGGRVVVLPTIPFGNNAQQMDQVATSHLSTVTAGAILRDVAASLARQGIRRLVILNGHGGNEFKPLVRDVMLEIGLTILVVDFWRVNAAARDRIFSDPGDHGGDHETSLVMRLRPELVDLSRAGPGKTVPWKMPAADACGAWTPRPWSRVHPDTGAGNPAAATAAKGADYFRAITATVADLLVEFSAAT